MVICNTCLKITHVASSNFDLTVPISPEIRDLAHPHCERLPVGDHHPLPEVELGVVDEQRALDVLLDHEVLAVLLGQDLVQTHSDEDS